VPAHTTQVVKSSSKNPQINDEVQDTRQGLPENVRQRDWKFSAGDGGQLIVA
jgi:hypothetical protein